MIGDVEEATALLKRASYSWGMHGDTAKCAEYLNKAAKEVFYLTGDFLFFKLSNFLQFF
jgi:hypothetical protein